MLVIVFHFKAFFPSIIGKSGLLSLHQKYNTVDLSELKVGSVVKLYDSYPGGRGFELHWVLALGKPSKIWS